MNLSRRTILLFAGSGVLGSVAAAAAGAATFLSARWDKFRDAPVIFRLDGRTWNPTGHEVGIEVDYATPLAQAYAWGRLGSWDTRLRQQRQTLEAPRDWRTSVNLDPHAFTGYVERIAAEIAQAPCGSKPRAANATPGFTRQAKVANW